MEQVLALYAEPVDPRRPRVCLDEVPVQLLRDPHPPTLPRPGLPARQDYTYDRAGTANLYVLFCPDRGWRHVSVTPRRRAQDFAHQLKALVDEHFPDAEQIRVVLDNLTAHRPAMLYATFPPAEAQRIAQKLAFTYTPPHASWLNMVEIENSILTAQCLDARYPDPERLQAAVTAWAQARNAAHATIDWRFTAEDAREKLHKLYPKLKEAK